MSDLVSYLEEYIRKQNLLKAGDKLVLAVSGGVDSVVMLDLFVRLRKEWNLSLVIAHLNHSLRGREADRDEFFVCGAARRYGLPFFSMKADVTALAQGQKLSIEEAARDVRFQFLRQLLYRLRFNSIALAHQADDQAETVLMRMTRGSGLRGLSGIRSKQGDVIHPLLFASRTDIEKYATDHGLPYVVDATNRDRRYLRNRIRYDVIPILRAHVNSKAVENICRTAADAAEAQEALEAVIHQILRDMTEKALADGSAIDLSAFQKIDPFLQRIFVIEWIRRFTDNTQVRRNVIFRILDLAKKGRRGGRIHVEGDLWIVRRDPLLVLVRRAMEWDPIPVHIGDRIDLSVCGLQFQSQLVNVYPGRFSSDERIGYLDLDRLTLPLLLRNCRPGDWFIPLGMSGRKKVNDYFIDEKVPIDQRRHTPLLVGGNDIVWIAGYRIDDRFRITDKTRSVLKVSIKPLDE